MSQFLQRTVVYILVFVKHLHVVNNVWFTNKTFRVRVNKQVRVLTHLMGSEQMGSLIAQPDGLQPQRLDTELVDDMHQACTHDSVCTGNCGVHLQMLCPHNTAWGRGGEGACTKPSLECTNTDHLVSHGIFVPLAGLDNTAKPI